MSRKDRTSMHAPPYLPRLITAVPAFLFRPLIPIILLTLLLVTSWRAPSACAEAVPASGRTIRVVMDDNYPPYVFKGADGALKGILVDQWRLWERKTGIKAEITAMDWAEAQRRMQEGEFDVIDTIFRNEQRERIYDFSKPYASLEVPLYFRSDISGISGIDDLRGFAVGVKAGGNVIGVLKSRGITNLVEFTSYEAIVAAARDHKINVFTVEKIPARYFLYKFGIQNQFRETSPLYTGQFHRAVAKGNSALLTTVENGFGSISKAEYGEIEKRWYGAPILNEELKHQLRLAAWLTSAVLGGLFLWLWLLRRLVARRTADLSRTIRELDYQKHLTASVINGTSDAIFVKDTGGRYILVNSEVERIFGMPAGEIIGKDDSAFFPAEAGGLMAGDREIMALDSPVTLEEELTTRDGRRIYQATKGPIRDDRGQVIGLFGVSRDITEKRRLDRSLEQKLEFLTSPAESRASVRFDQLFNLEEIQKIQDSFALATNVASLITDPDGVPITRPSNFSDLCRTVIHKTEKGLANCRRSATTLGRMNPGGPIVQSCPSGGLMDGGASIHVGDHHVANWLIGQVLDEACDMDAMRAYAAEIGADAEEYRQALARVPRMSRAQFERVCQALFQIAGQLSGMAMQNVNQAQYIMERKRAESEHRHLEEQLRQSQKMEAVGQLAGGIAHDFNNILQVIMGYAGVLEVRTPEGSRDREAVEQIIASAEKAAQLTRGLLTFSRKQVLDQKVENLNEIVRHVQNFLVRIIGEDIHFKAVLNELELPVRVDAGQIEQVLMNLATNARDAMPKGGLLTIETGVREIEEAQEMAAGNGRPGRYACVAVSDTGIGMDGETRARIFEPFFTTKEVGKGTGLGMAIVYGIVSQHNGFVDIYSEPGVGSTFRVFIPLVESAPAGQREKARQAAPRRGTETILVAEDDAAVRDLVVSVLADNGYEVLQACDGEEAVGIFADNRDRIALILMDMIMPRKNGKEAYDEICRIRPGTRVLFSSGYTAEFLQNRGVKEEVDLVMKPIQPVDLLRRVREMLDA